MQPIPLSIRKPTISASGSENYCLSPQRQSHPHREVPQMSAAICSASLECLPFLSQHLTRFSRSLPNVFRAFPVLVITSHLSTSLLKKRVPEKNSKSGYSCTCLICSKYYTSVNIIPVLESTLQFWLMLSSDSADTPSPPSLFHVSCHWCGLDSISCFSELKWTQLVHFSQSC